MGGLLVCLITTEFLGLPGCVNWPFATLEFVTTDNATLAALAKETCELPE
jgi:hypothetical protein